MASMYETGDIVDGRPVFVDETHIQWVNLVVDRENPDGWLRVNVLSPTFRNEEQNLQVAIPVRAVISGTPKIEKDPKGYIDAYWYDFEQGIAHPYAKPIQLKQDSGNRMQ